MTQQRKPFKGDLVWVEGRKPEPNGKVHRIDYQGDEVAVIFNDNGGIKYYHLDDFDNKVGRIWKIYAQRAEDEVEERLDVMVLFDLCLKDQNQYDSIEDKIPRLIFLSYYFSNDYRYVIGCQKRREILARLIAEHGTKVNWARVTADRDIHLTGARISTRLRQARLEDAKFTCHAGQNEANGLAG